MATGAIDNVFIPFPLCRAQ